MAHVMGVSEMISPREKYIKYMNNNAMVWYHIFSDNAWFFNRLGETQ